MSKKTSGSMVGRGRLEALLSPKLFKALSDPKRLSLLVRLALERTPRTVGELTDGSGVDPSVVSRHLAVLRDAGVIACEKRGREVFCSVETTAVVTILRDLADALEACCPAGRAAATQDDTPSAARTARTR